MNAQNPFSSGLVLYPMVARWLVTVVWSVTLLFAIQTHAATLSWSGAGGANANWNNITNWGFAGIPTNGDTLVFPAGQPNLINTNNISNLTLNQIRFAGAGGGYAIFGNAITITNGIEATNTSGINALSNNITLGSPTDFVVDVATGAKLFLGGTLSGTVGLVKGGGTNTLGGSFNNTYSGTTTVTNGLLELSKFGAMAAAIPHDLIIGNGIAGSTVRNLAGFEIADSGNVTVNRLSTWDLDDNIETISALTLSGGSVTTGTGTLTLGGNITSIASINMASISGLLSLGGVTRTISVGSGSPSPDLLISANISEGSASAGITKTGLGQLTLSGSNSFTGVLTIDGFMILSNDFAAGATGSSTNRTELHANSFLLVQGANIGNEFLTLTNNDDFRSSGAASWAGPITLNGDVFINVFGGTFTNSGAITGAGGVTKGQSGTLIYAGSGANTYLGDTIVNTGELQLAKTIATAGIVNGTLTIGDDLGGDGADVVREMGPNQINSSIPITINSSGLLDLNNFSDAIGALTFSGGHLSSGTGTATLTGNVTALANTNNLARIDGKVTMSSTRTYDVANGIWSPDLRVDAAVSGAGGILKIGAGEMSLTASNSYTGLTTVVGGFMRLEDSFALGATSSGTVVSNGASLSLLFGINVGLEPLTLNGPGTNTIGALASLFGSNSWAGDITFATDTTISVTTNDFLYLGGALLGAGGFTKTSPGTLELSGPGNSSTYAGDTFVNEGTVLLNSINVIRHGTLTIGDGLGGNNADVVRYTAAFPIFGGPGGSTVLIKDTGLLDLNGFNDDVGPIAVVGGKITTGTGVLTLFPPLTTPNGSTTNGTASISGILSLANGSATFGITNDLNITASVVGGVTSDVLTINGGANLHLLSSNSYSALTVVQQGWLWAHNAFALGGSTSGTIVSNNASLVLSGVFGITNESLTLGGGGATTDWGALDTETAGTNFWVGPIILNGNTTIAPYPSSAVLRINGAISGPGSLRVGAADGNGTGQLYFDGSAANTYAGATTVGSGTLLLNKTGFDLAVPGNLIIGDGVGGTNADVVRLLNVNQIPNTANVTVSGFMFVSCVV